MFITTNYVYVLLLSIHYYFYTDIIATDDKPSILVLKIFDRVKSFIPIKKNKTKMSNFYQLFNWS